MCNDLNLKKIFKNIYRLIPFKKEFYQLVRWLPLSELVYRHLHFIGRFTVPVFATERFHIMHWGNQVENDLFWAGYAKNWEATSLCLWANLAKNSDLIIDIGANTGVYSLAAHAVNDTSDIWAFEPVLRIYEKLLVNTDLNNSRISAFNLAVSDSEGEAILYDFDTEHSYSASLNVDMMEGRSQNITETKIKKVSMDGFLENRKISKDLKILIKVDVEMHELEVIAGFRKSILVHRPMFLIEILNENLGLKIADEFNGKNYSFYEIYENDKIKKTDVLGMAEMNYFICPNERLVDLGFDTELSHQELMKKYD